MCLHIPVVQHAGCWLFLAVWYISQMEGGGDFTRTCNTMFCIQIFEQQIAVYVETVLSRAPHPPSHPFFLLFFSSSEFTKETQFCHIFVSVASDILEHFGPVFTLLGAHLPCSCLSLYPLRLWFYLIPSHISLLDFICFCFYWTW